MRMGKENRDRERRRQYTRTETHVWAVSFRGKQRSSRQKSTKRKLLFANSLQAEFQIKEFKCVLAWKWYFAWKGHCTIGWKGSIISLFLKYSGVILKELCHSETEQKRTNIFMVLSELFLITTRSNTFSPFNRRMEVNIFRTYARAEFLVLGTVDILGQRILCCGKMSSAT